MRMLVIALMVVVAGCATVRKEDLDAWQGAPLIELQTHPVYSTMQLVKTPLADGSELFDYVATRGPQTNCYTDAYGNTNCSTSQTTCHHQFFIKSGVVAQYRPIGRCKTGCDRRPASKPCTTQVTSAN